MYANIPYIVQAKKFLNKDSSIEWTVREINPRLINSTRRLGTTSSHGFVVVPLRR